MQRPSIYFLYNQLDELEKHGMLGPYIPTFGHATSIIDSYRTVAFSNVQNCPDSWCFTDIDSASALGRLIDGPIQSASDIEKAEVALRSILLHEIVHIVSPVLKADFGNNNFQYIRLDDNLRNEASFEAFNAAPSTDLLLTPELVQVRNGEIISSSNLRSKLLGNSAEDHPKNLNELLTSTAELINTLPMQVNAAAHYSAEKLVAPLKQGPFGFIDQLYQRMSLSWKNIAQIEPPLFVNLKLPPLIAIVLNRANNRQDIPTVLKDLREELSAVRSELIQLNNFLTSSISQSDLNTQVKRINESFDAIVAESLLSKSERYMRRLITIFNFLRPMRQIYSLTVDPTSIKLDQFLELHPSIQKAVTRDSRIVSRTVAATKFAELLQTESVASLLKGHLTENEINLFRYR